MSDPSRRLRRGLGAWLLLMVGACAHRGSKVDAAGTRALAAVSEPPLALRWSPDGTHLLVGERWLLEPASGLFAPVNCPFTGEVSSGPCRAPASFSPEGGRLMFLEGGDLAIVPLAMVSMPTAPPSFSPPGVSRVVFGKIPRWSHAGERADLVNVAFWLAPDQVLVQQFDRGGEGSQECRQVDVPPAPTSGAVGSAWVRPVGGCLDTDFHHLTRVDPGPGGWLALHSEGEGGFALGLVRFTPERGQISTAAPSITLEGASVVSVRFARDGSSVDLISPCDLSASDGRRGPACDDPFSRPRWTLFTRALPAGPLRLRRADLPPGAVLQPGGERFAWPAAGSVCIGEPAGPAAPSCFSPPAS